MFKSRNYILVLFLLFFFSCSNNLSFHDYVRWRITGQREDSYLRNHPKEVEAIYFVMPADTSINATGEVLDTVLTRFDAEGRIIYARNSSGLDTQEDHYFFTDEGLIQQTILSRREAGHVITDTSKVIRKRLDERSFVTGYYHSGQIYQSDTTTFGMDSDVRLKRVNSAGGIYTLVSWYKNNQVVKDEGSDGYGRTGRVYHRDAKGNLESVSFSNPDQEIVSINNEYGDPLLYCTILGHDTTQMDRNQYIYDSHGNWTRRLRWQKNLEAPVALMPNPRNPHYDLTVRTIRY